MGERGRKITGIILIALILQGIGTVGFAEFEGIEQSEAAYQTLLILLAHFDHYGFHQPNSRVLVIFLVVSSLIVVAYLLKWFAEYMIGIGDNVKKRRMKAHIDKLKEHYVVCGYGRVGSQVALELANEGVTFVVVDKDQAKIDDALKAGYLAVCADSTVEETLKELGVERANGLIASLGDDSSNLFVTLAARALSPDIYIVARANRAENQAKLKHAGADRVAMPYQIGGYHMANMAIRPNIVDYMDIVNSSKTTQDLAVEEMLVGENSKLAGHKLGRALADASIQGATVIAINGADGASKVRPDGNEVIYPGDRLIVLGAKKDLTEASALIR
jgi:voltage-gated potassium channel